MMLVPLSGQVIKTEVATTQVRKSCFSMQSVVATGGGYRGQGRNAEELLTPKYEEVLVHGCKLQQSIP